MALLQDWMELAGSTLRSIETRDFSGLYEEEWPETRRRLTEEHASEIAKDREAWRRTLRSGGALMYGLAKRLAPQRRLLFLLSWILVVLAVLLKMFGGEPSSFWGTIYLLAAIGILTLLLGMELIDKIKFRDELELARELQADLIPTNLPQCSGWRIDAFNQIANTVGGDIYDFVPLPDGRIGVLFGDASGHGMAAGLVMAVAHAAFRTQLDVDPAPCSVFAVLNRILCRSGGPRSFFAGVYMLLEPDGGYEAIIAGHPPLIHLGSQGTVEEIVGRGSYPLGIKTGVEWPVERGRIEPNGTIVLHSDGLAEARNGSGENFGYERVRTLAERNALRSPRELLWGLVGEYQAFIGFRSPEDDVTVAVIRREVA